MESVQAALTSVIKKQSVDVPPTKAAAVADQITAEIGKSSSPLALGLQTTMNAVPEQIARIIMYAVSGWLVSKGYDDQNLLVAVGGVITGLVAIAWWTVWSRTTKVITESPAPDAKVA